MSNVTIACSNPGGVVLMLSDVQRPDGPAERRAVLAADQRSRHLRVRFHRGRPDVLGDVVRQLR